MRYITFTVTAILVLLFLAACSKPSAESSYTSTKSYASADVPQQKTIPNAFDDLNEQSETKESPEEQPLASQETQPETRSPSEPATTSTPVIPTTSPAISPVIIAPDEIKELLTRHTSIKSFGTNVDDGTLNAYSIKVHGSKIRKEIIVQPMYDNNTVIDTVYLDRAAKTAYGACFDGFICPKGRQNLAFPADFYKEDVLSPTDIIPKSGLVQQVGKEQIDGRPTIIIEYNNSDTNRERLWLDAYSGIPMRQRIYSDERTSLEHTFTRLAVNAYSEEDVSVPATFNISNT